MLMPLTKQFLHKCTKLAQLGNALLVDGKLTTRPECMNMLRQNMSKLMDIPVHFVTKSVNQKMLSSVIDINITDSSRFE